MLGLYATGKEAEENAVKHIGLLVSEMCIDLGAHCDVGVYHMGPPLEKGVTSVDLLGLITDLQHDNLIKMEQWIREMLRSEFKDYHVRPGSIIVQSDNPGGPPTEVRFSCAGFVERCYRDALKWQLVVDEPSLPEVSLDKLMRIWVEPRLLRALRIPKLRERYGLHGDGPWRILMPAYLFHAIRHFDANGRSASPYQPRDGDWQFV